MKILLLILSMFLFFENVEAVKVPNDPFYEQWGYEKTGIYEAWDITTGTSSVVVAVIDNGIDYTHPDLKDNIWVNKKEICGNRKDDDKNGYIDDCNGWNFYDNSNDIRPNVRGVVTSSDDYYILHHGTVVAGIIGAVGNNNESGVGINWNVKIMPIKILGNSGRGNINNFDKAIRYAVDNGAHIINISIVGGVSDQTNEAIEYAYKKGVLVVAAAGNDNQDLDIYPTYPICSTEKIGQFKVIGVNAVAENRRLSQFSNYGSNCIDITAPGVDISSTIRYAPKLGLEYAYGSGWNGTSFATPFVTGVGALIKSLNKNLTGQKIAEAIFNTVHRTPGQNEETYEQFFGNGFLQADKAVLYARGSSSTASRVESSYAIFDNITGFSEIYDHIRQGNIFFDISYLVGSKDVDIYRYNGLINIVTLNQGNGVLEVKIYDDSKIYFSLIKTVLLDVNGEYNLRLANVYGDSEYEIILFPKTESKEIFRIYNKNGELLKLKTFRKSHSHVNLGFSPLNGTEKEEIIASFNITSIAKNFYHYNEEFNIKNKFLLPRMDKVLGVDTSNLDRGEFEYSVFGEYQSKNQLYLYSTKNTQKKVYDFPYVSDFGLIFADFNQKTKDDIIYLGKQEDKTVLKILDANSEEKIKNINSVFTSTSYKLREF